MAENIYEDDQIVMQNEWRRVFSFATFPDHNFVSTILLARSGFYYTGRGGLCRCYFCGSEESNWRGDIEYFLSHCEENSRRETNEPIYQEIDGHFSEDLLTQLCQTPSSRAGNGFQSASNHSFNRLWEGMGTECRELPLDSYPDHSNQQLFQWLRIHDKVDGPRCQNLNSSHPPHLRESTTPTTFNSTIFQHLRICKETHSRCLSSENNNVTSNQSIREIIEGEASENEGIGMSPVQINIRKLGEEQTNRILHPSISYFCHQKTEYLVKESIPSVPNSRNKPVLDKNKCQAEFEITVSEANNNSQNSTQEESIFMQTKSEDCACSSCPLGLHQRLPDSSELSDFDYGQSLDMSGSFCPSGSSRPKSQSNNPSELRILRRHNEDFLGQECPPMSRSVRNTQQIPQTYRERFASFHNWPHHIKQRPNDMVDAGFYYTGNDDCVRCSYCNISLYKWESNDIPLEEHARYSPDCKFIQQCRQRQQHLALENQPRRESITLDQIKDLDSLKEVLDFSFNIDDILRAYNTLSHTLDIRDLTSTDILSFFFEADQEEEEESFSGEGSVCCMCSDRVVYVIFLPCLHGCCEECDHEAEQCPFCCQYIKAVHRVYVV